LENTPDWLFNSGRALVLLPPKNLRTPARVGAEVWEGGQYDRLLARAQRLRGSIYLEDGAITRADLTADGRHATEADYRAWHVLCVDSGDQVRGCARYLPHDPRAPFSSLVTSNSALAQDAEWGGRLRTAIEIEMAKASEKGVAYAELGGWAMDRSVRCTGDALRIALGMYALSRRLGGCIGITTATVRHRSADTLQKIGGSMLTCQGTPLPQYFDPQYSCQMAILRFQSDQASPRFESWIDCLEVQLRTTPVVYSCPVRPRRLVVPAPFERMMETRAAAVAA
jgi:hypothetical protein